MRKITDDFDKRSCGNDHTGNRIFYIHLTSEAKHVNAIRLLMEGRGKNKITLGRIAGKDMYRKVIIVLDSMSRDGL